ncbi:hypothetical protein TETCHI4_000049 [Candidatus Hodgkinia cicadicola]|nr:hypothetical protein TETCHI4_000049 [Candidatus Hodgkinia cicadicola]
MAKSALKAKCYKLAWRVWCLTENGVRVRLECVRAAGGINVLSYAHAVFWGANIGWKLEAGRWISARVARAGAGAGLIFFGGV